MTTFKDIVFALLTIVSEKKIAQEKLFYRTYWKSLYIYIYVPVYLFLGHLISITVRASLKRTSMDVS